MSIVVGGASGQLGRKVTEYLLERGVAPEELILVTRTPDALGEAAARGVTVRHGDYNAPETLPDAFAGGTTLLIISTDTIPGREVQHRAAVQGAVAAGVKRVAYTSILSPEPENPAVAVPSHRATEDALRESGLSWTFLRNGLYAEYQLPEALFAVSSGTLAHNRGNGRAAYISRDDCAAAAAAVLSTPGHDNVAYDITGPEALGVADLATLYGELAGGRPLEIVELDDDTFKAGMVGEATGDDHRVFGAELVTSFGRAVREGHLSSCTTSVADLTGRAPRTLREVLAPHRDQLVEAASTAA
jgi:NAD(P)H dehydrogenase (quinone)